jgi:hypothetical protein
VGVQRSKRFLLNLEQARVGAEHIAEVSIHCIPSAGAAAQSTGGTHRFARRPIQLVLTLCDFNFSLQAHNMVSAKSALLHSKARRQIVAGFRQHPQDFNVIASQLKPPCFHACC